MKKIILVMMILLFLIPYSYSLDYNISLISSTPFDSSSMTNHTISYDGILTLLEVNNNEGVVWTEFQASDNNLSERGTNGAYFNHTFYFNTTFIFDSNVDTHVFKIFIVNQTASTWGGLLFNLLLDGEKVGSTCGGSRASGNNLNNFHLNNSIVKGDYECNTTLFNGINWQYQLTSTEYRNIVYLYMPDLIDVGNNNLPVFNVSVSDTIPCLNSTRGETELNITLDAFDFEGDTILYSLRADENNVFILADFTGTITPLNIQVCTIGKLISDIVSPLPIFSRLILLNDGIGCTSTQFSEYNPLSNKLPEFANFESCNITDSISNQFYITEQVNSRGDVIPMLYLNPSCSSKKEVYLKTDVGLRNLTFATNLVINELVNNSFVITFYDNPETEYGKVVQLFFNLSGDSNVMEVFNSQNKTGLVSILNFSMDNDNNKQGLYRYLGIQLNYDFSGDIYNLSVKTLNGSFYDITNVLGYWNNTGTNTLVKYVGIELNENHVLGDIYIENFYYGGFTLTVSPFYSTEKPTSVFIRRVGSNNLNFYVTDTVHENTDFVFQNVGVSVVECESPYAYKSKDDVYLGLLRGGSIVYNGLCTSFGTIFTVFGDTTLNMCNIFYFVYLIMCLVVSLVLAFFMIRTFLNPALTFGVSALVFSLSQLLLYEIFLYSRGLIILYSMIFAVSCISLFVSLFIPKSSVGG